MSSNLSEVELKRLSECEAMLMSNDPIEIPDEENHDYVEWEMLVSEPQFSNIVRDNLDFSNSVEQLRVLTTELREIIKKEKKVVQEISQQSWGSIVNPNPISYYVSSDYNYNFPLSLEFTSSNSSQEEKKKKRGKAVLVGTNNTSFKLSETSIAYAMNLEKESLQNSKNGNKNVLQYSLSERLEGWRIDRKLRADGRTFDMFFKHLKSKSKFRSVKEVINFILHEVYATNTNKDALEENYLSVPPGFEEPYSFPPLISQ